MFFFAPYDIEAMFARRPVVNWSIVGVTTFVSILAFYVLPAEAFELFILQRGSLSGLLGHVLVHADWFHLIGNMLFLWVFGNAVCANMKPLAYLAIYIAAAIASALAHVALDSGPAVGASGAINGVVGLAVAAYPRDRVRVFWLFFVKWGTTTVRLWILALLWLVFDLWGAIVGGGLTAHWAHLGGFAAGVGLGLVALQSEWIIVTSCDRPNLLQMLARHANGR